MIEDCKISNANVKCCWHRKEKGQSEVRLTLYGDAVKHLGTWIAMEIERKDVIDLVNSIVARGANVQAGDVLRELSLTYEFAKGLGRFADDFANPALLAKSMPKTNLY